MKIPVIYLSLLMMLGCSSAPEQNDQYVAEEEVLENEHFDDVEAQPGNANLEGEITLTLGSESYSFNRFLAGHTTVTLQENGITISIRDAETEGDILISIQGEQVAEQPEGVYTHSHSSERSELSMQFMDLGLSSDADNDMMVLREGKFTIHALNYEQRMLEASAYGTARFMSDITGKEAKSFEGEFKLPLGEVIDRRP